MRFILYSCFLLLAGCNPVMTPMMQKSLASIALEPIPDTIGYSLQKELERHLKTRGHIEYKLIVKLDKVISPLDRGLDAKTQVLSMVLKADYQLMRCADGVIVNQGHCFVSDTLALRHSFYSQTVSKDYLWKSAAVIMADQLIQKIILWLSSS